MHNIIDMLEKAHDTYEAAIRQQREAAEPTMMLAWADIANAALKLEYEIRTMLVRNRKAIFVLDAHPRETIEQLVAAARIFDLFLDAEEDLEDMLIEMENAGLQCPSVGGYFVIYRGE